MNFTNNEFEHIKRKISNAYKAPKKPRNISLKHIDTHTAELTFQETPHTPTSTVMMYKLYASVMDDSRLVQNVQETLKENSEQGKYSLFLTTDGYQSIGRFKERLWYTHDNPKDNPTKQVELSSNEKQIIFPFSRDSNIITVLDPKHNARWQVYKIKIKYLDIEENGIIPHATKVLPLTDMKRETYDLLIPYFNYEQPAFLLPKNRIGPAESMYQRWKAHYPTPHFAQLFDMPKDQQIKEIKRVQRKEKKVDSEKKKKKTEQELYLEQREEEWSQLEKARHIAVLERDIETYLKIVQEQGIEYPEFNSY